MARPRQIRQGTAGTRQQRRTRPRDNEGLIPVLARAVREVETAVQRQTVKPSDRSKFQAIALLTRQERARVKADEELSDTQRDTEMKRLDGIATILATSAVGDASLLVLLAEDAPVSDQAKLLQREMLRAAGREVSVPSTERTETAEETAAAERRVVPRSVISRQLANPFLPPESAVGLPRPGSLRRLAGWALIDPLLQSFEYADGGAVSCMALPDAAAVKVPGDLELMPHQSQVVGAARAGHRTFLLADEPGLGKTAQALLAAEAAEAYPLLVVVPNVVKTNWAREGALWTPRRPVSVIHGNGEGLDAFADIFVINYEILDRHVGWLGDFGFRGMVVDEAHFIKNTSSQRSQNVLRISERIRARTLRPLFMALTGTPLINHIDDFRAIWRFLGWIDDKKPLNGLAAALEDTGLTPADTAFYPAARAAVIEQGIVRRRKVDVAADIPARRIADIPVELDPEVGRSLRDAERRLAQRLLDRYLTAMQTRRAGPSEDIDPDLVRRVARAELEETRSSQAGDNVFAMLRRIGRAKAELAAEYAAELAHSTGKVVFFAKHLDVLDAAQEHFDRRGLRWSAIRGDQTSATRQREIDAFVKDPDVAVIVCSLTAAGVGVNLQVASDVVLAELSWTDAEQTQAIDRVHRIGQDQPVTAWRIIAAQTLDTRIAALIDSKAGLAARALDGSDEEVRSSGDVQLEALVALLTEALSEPAVATRLTANAS